MHGCRCVSVPLKDDPAEGGLPRGHVATTSRPGRRGALPRQKIRAGLSPSPDGQQPRWEP